MRFRAFIIIFATCLSCPGVEPHEDLLSFTNGDQLHGQLSGIAAGPSILWKRQDVAEPVKFKSSELRRIVLRGGKPARYLESLSHIGTSNGDRIPGTVREMDDKRLVIDTVFGGVLEIPRERLGLIAPNPYGGKVLYHGPYDPEEWVMINNEHLDGIPALKLDEDSKIPLWRHSGGAWYWQNQQTGTALVKKAGMLDRSILRFDIAWKSRLSCIIAFHSNFRKPPEVAELNGGHKGLNAGNSASLPHLFGESYLIELNSFGVRLHKTFIDAAGSPRIDRVQTTNNNNLRLGDTGAATVELRCNRPTGEIFLFINGEFVVQWSEIADGVDEATGYAGKGEGFGFLVQAEESPVRISEVVVAEWNGMPDAARSLQVDDQDIVLLSNGTDRLSGKVTSLQAGKLKVEGRYGDFEFPLSEIAEVRFAKSRLAEPSAASADEMMTRLFPIGRISGRLVEGDAGRLRVLTEAVGQIDIKLDYAVILEFSEPEHFLDTWDEEF
jgi:hypothetical protein